MIKKKKKKNKKIIQSGVIPFTFKNKKLRILIVTNSSRNKWLFPKGLVEKEMTKEESAGLEAFEEAGVIGEVLMDKIGSYEIIKYGSVCKVDMFPLLVDKVLKNWPEEKIRKRKWISPEEIVEYITDERILRVVNKFTSQQYYKLV